MKTKFNFKTALVEEYYRNAAYLFNKVVPKDYKLTAEDVVLMTKHKDSVDNLEFNAAEIFSVLKAEAKRPDLITEKLILLSIKQGIAGNMLNVITKDFATQEIVDKLLKAEPIGLENAREHFNASVLKKFVTKEHCEAYIKKGGYQLDAVKYQTRELIIKAIDNGARSFWSVAPKFRNLGILIRIGANKSFQKKYEYSEYGDNLERGWGLNKTQLRDLLELSIIPSLSKVPEFDKEDVERACYAITFKKNPKVIATMPDKLKALITPQGAIKVANAEMIQHLPKKLITDEVIEAYQENYSSSLRDVEKEYLTEDMCERLVKENSREVEHVPTEMMSEYICDMVMEDSSENLKRLPEAWREKYYVKVAKAGWGFNQIPEDKRTEKLCVIAVEARGANLEHVPEDKKSYAIVLSAVDGDIEAYNFLPENFEDDDHEVKIRAMISVLNEDHLYRGAKIEAAEKVLKAYSQYGWDRREMYIEIINRQPELFSKMSDEAHRSSEFSNFLDQDVCIAAFKKDKKYISKIPQVVLTSVFKEFVESKEKNSN
jgi:hypothetical protein